jgi:hypothetical protein
VLFAPGGLLDATRYVIILPDDIGHGHRASRADRLRAKFPHYGSRVLPRAVRTSFRSAPTLVGTAPMPSPRCGDLSASVARRVTKVSRLEFGRYWLKAANCQLGSITQTADHGRRW